MQFSNSMWYNNLPKKLGKKKFIHDKISLFKVLPGF